MVTNEMQARYLRRILTQPVRLKLFTRTDGVNESGIVEVQGGGYRDIPLVLGDWRIASVPSAFAEADVQNFRFDGSLAVRVMGSYMVQESDGGLLFMKAFDDGPFDLSRPGDTVPVLPVFKLGILS